MKVVMEKRNHFQVNSRVNFLMNFQVNSRVDFVVNFKVNF